MKIKFLLMTRVFWLMIALCIGGLHGLKAQTYVSIGTGSLVNSAISYPAPYGNFFYGARHQFLILASELSTAGVAPNSVISQIGFNVQSPIAAPLQNFKIKMGTTLSTTLTTTFITAGLSDMFDPITYTTTPGWNTHTFTNGGFVWDGLSNIIVEVCFNNNSWTSNALSYYSTTSGARSSYRYADAQGNCTDPGYQTSTARPNMRLTIGGVNLPPPIAPLANFQFVLGVDTLWERSPSILTNTSTYQDKSYWDVTGYNDDSTDGVWEPFYTVRQQNAWGIWMDTIGNKANFNFKFPLAGYYKVKLLCVNSFGVSEVEKIVFVALPTVKPRAYFFANMVETGVGEQIQFYDASSNGPIGWTWWLDPPCISCGQFINEFFPSNDLPRPVLNANEGGTYNVCMAVWNDIGSDTICRTNYIRIIDGFEICNGTDSITYSPKGYLHAPYFQTYTSLYYAAQACPASSPGFRLAPCADTIFVSLERLKMRNQDSLYIRTGSYNGPIIRRWGGNNINNVPDSSKSFKYPGNELFIRFVPGTPNTPTPYWVNDSGFLLKWSIAPASFPAPTPVFTSLDTVYSGYKMQFTNATQGSNIAFAWDLNGDNIFGLDNPFFPDSVTPSPTFTYFTFSPITKNVCLRARNCQGSAVTCKPVVVLPIARAPVADFTVNKTNGFTTDTFYFSDISQYGANGWKWTFNPGSVTYLNGTSSNSQYPMVKFNVAQQYSVTLEASNPFGSTSITKTNYITTLSYSPPGSIYPPQSSDLDIGISRVYLLGTAGKIDTITPLKNATYSSYYLSSQAVVYRGVTYSVDVYRESAEDPMNTRIWIDFNRNTDYLDTGETILSEDSTNTVKTTAQFTVPNDASTGLSRMLIGVSPEFSSITPTLATLGVYEDHGLVVGQDMVKPVVTLKGGEIYKTEVNRPYVEPGAEAFDNLEGNISGRIVYLGSVDITKVGYYKLKYYVVDNYDNVSDTAYRLVMVEVSTIPPIITMTPPDTITMEVYGKFNEPGISAKDHYNNDMTQYIVRGGNLDTAHVGTYMVTYRVSDAFGNTATASRVVIVRDTQKPVITSRLGKDTITHEIKTPFEDNDYIKVTDNYWKNLGFTRSNSININKRGIWPLKYDAVDGSGNEAISFTLYVRVKNTQGPTIVLNGEPDVLVNVFGTYTEQGATAKDFEGTPLVVEITNTVNTQNVNNYTNTYVAWDIDDNFATITRSIRVRDTEAPKIFLLGKDPYYTPLDTPYDDPGIKVTDNYNSESQLIITKDTRGINWKKEGQYTAYYNAADSSGNVAAQKTRVVIVTSVQINGIKEMLQTDGYAIYPNPASDQLNIDLKDAEIKNIVLYDLQGKEVVKLDVSKGIAQYQMDMSKQQAGMYLLQIETAEGRIINHKCSVVR